MKPLWGVDDYFQALHGYGPKVADFRQSPERMDSILPRLDSPEMTENTH